MRQSSYKFSLCASGQYCSISLTPLGCVPKTLIVHEEKSYECVDISNSSSVIKHCSAKLKN